MIASPSTFLTENLVGLNEAARLLPPGRQGRPVSFSCVLRWIVNGLPGPDGTRVRLEAIRLGGRWLTSREALSRWADKLTPSFQDVSPGIGRTVKQRKTSHDKATEALAKLGI